MRNAEVDRLEAKLKLWETPGFSQFLNDLDEEVWTMSNRLPSETALILRKRYFNKLKKLETQESKYKQGELDL